jgi:hypothetical protein
MIYPEGGKGGRGKKNLELSSEFFAKHVQQARGVGSKLASLNPKPR